MKKILILLLALLYMATSWSQAEGSFYFSQVQVTNGDITRVDEPILIGSTTMSFSGQSGLWTSSAYIPVGRALRYVNTVVDAGDIWHSYDCGKGDLLLVEYTGRMAILLYDATHISWNNKVVFLR
jgi:hypothetical protein